MADWLPSSSSGPIRPDVASDVRVEKCREKGDEGKGCWKVIFKNSNGLFPTRTSHEFWRCISFPRGGSSGVHGKAAQAASGDPSFPKRKRTRPREKMSGRIAE
ncbi:hypothetical protein F5144DRAFT_545469 [Chaetomium tenue]|uniref:Uncharacterized protein n=1 Tax=Chaetomium tenue TaxID=1854479 RepID=A0ACB7PK36_9PEZI|nr:hypothetical protein F5144DRAFT_545469 [Chaetomium globosum]